LGSAVLLLAGVAALMMTGGSLAEFLMRYGRRQLGGEAWLSMDVALATAEFNRLLWEMAPYVLPLLGAILVAAIVVNLGQVGFLFLPSKVGMDLTRLDVFQALRRMFSLSNSVRLAFGLFKIGVIVAVAAICLQKELPTILALAGLSLEQIASYLGHVLLWTTLKIGLALLVLAILDYGYQYWQHEQDLKMTPQELREEMRNLEGDPQMISRRRAVQRQLVLNRLSSTVPKADVVITNPTELAVAIQYEPGSMAAPIVVAKGAGLVAQRIRLIAIEHGIPIVQKKPLAQALYREVEVNHPIPHDKYAAVAELLAYVYQLKGKKISRAA
jgi:flagellar biosynthetic protein FlhB